MIFVWKMPKFCTFGPDICIANGIVFVNISLAYGTISKMLMAQPYPKFGIRPRC